MLALVAEQVFELAHHLAQGDVMLVSTIILMKCSSAPDLGRALNDLNSSRLVAAKRASSTRLPKCVFNSAPLMYRCVITPQTCSPTVFLLFPRVL